MFLSENMIPDYSIGYRIGMIVLVVICLLPWLVLVGYIIFKKYRINFYDANLTVLLSKYYKANQEIIYPENFELSGYQFDGWYLDANFEKKFDLVKMPKQNLKVYGKWVKLENDKEEI